MVTRMGTRADVAAALQAVDTGTLRAIADETGIGLRTLWRYRGGTEIPQARLRPLSKALGLR
jgi:hypothetical protein